MGSGPVCVCKKPLAEKKKNWVVTKYKYNNSHFEFNHYADSDYSEIQCLECGYSWRTKAGYVEGLRSMNWNDARKEHETRRKNE